MVMPKITFPIVGLSFSDGGIPALSQLFARLPADAGMSFVLLSPGRARRSESIQKKLSSITNIPIHKIRQGMAVKPGNIYLAPADAPVAIGGGILQLSPSPSAVGTGYAMDHFLRSLAADCGNQAIAVVLSGNPLDGTQGCAAIQSAGGITIAEDHSSSARARMARGAIENGFIDFALSPQDIAPKLSEIGVRLSRAQLSPGLLDEHHLVLACLQEATGINLGHYSQHLLQCGINRRMTLNNIETLNQYLRYVNEKPSELRSLFRDLLSTFTPFFDCDFPSEALSKQVFPALLRDRKASDAPIRIWVPGCSTGEEAYSIAIILSELFTKSREGASHNGRSAPSPIQIFATDIKDAALEIARAGVYPQAHLAHVSPQRLKNYFHPSAGGYLIAKSVRDMCIFARQDLANDPPFSRMDLICCRHLLFRLRPLSQKHVIAKLHYALNAAGCLILGGSENVHQLSDHFAPADRNETIFRKKSPSSYLVPYFPKDVANFTPSRGVHRGGPPSSGAEELKQAENLLISRYLPASIIINEDLQILRIGGRLGQYLEPAAGAPTFDLAKIAGEPLLKYIRPALQLAKQKNHTVRKRNVPIESQDHVRSANLEITPILPASGNLMFLIVFQDELPAAQHPRRLKRTNVSGVLRENKLLAQQSTRLKEQLQSATQTHEITAEEYQAAAQELQTTNEELEKAKRELQSGNEELRVLNERLHTRNSELLETNQELASVLANVNIPLMIVDQNFRIRRFTPPAQKLLNLQPSDVGRRLREIRPNLEAADLEELARGTVEHMASSECELRETRIGKWYSVRVRPYRSSSNRAEGAVFSFHDIDVLKRNLDQTRVFADALIENAREALLILDPCLRVTLANSAFCRLFQITASEAEGKLIYDLSEKRWDIPELRILLDEIIQHNQRADDFEVCHSFPHLGTRTMCVNARRIEPHEGEYLILLAIEDVSEKKRQTEALRRLSTYSMRVQDDERRRIARDLHDITGQKLALQSMNLAQMLRRLHDNPGVLSIARECQSLTDQISSEIRTLSYLLHPPLLDELGLSSALHWYAQGFESRTGIRVTVDVPSDLMRLSPETEVTLFRVVQESLTNIHRYANSPTAIIRVNVDAEEMTLEIIDHGKGMEVNAVAPESFSAERPGVGIQGMRERMRQLSGRLEIVSVPNRGTRVIAVLPLEGLVHEEVPAADENSAAGPPSAEPQAQASPNARVLIADDHEIMRQGVRTLLASEVNWEICGEAMNGREAVEKTAQLSPDLVILDLNMPVLDGLAALREIVAKQPLAKVLVLTVHDSEGVIHEIFTAGAHGCLLKSQTAHDLVRAVKMVLSGQVFRPDPASTQKPEPEHHRVARAVH
jgi:two-component system CheB/CheR fusion protein